MHIYILQVPKSRRGGKKDGVEGEDDENPSDLTY